jgi:hypothetical protein
MKNLLTIFKKHWKNANEIYLLVIMLVAWLTFPTWVRVLYAIFYPTSDFVIGTTDPGYLQNIVLGIVAFLSGAAITWYHLKFTFPKMGAWMDDIFELRAFTDRTFSAVDRYRAKIMITVYLVELAIITYAIVKMMPSAI